MSSGVKKWLRLGALTVGGFLALRFLLPLAAPFLLGTLLALGSEPMVRFFRERCGLGRGMAAGLGVTMTLSLLILTVILLCGLAVRQLRLLADILPELEMGIRTGLGSLSGWLLGLAARAPEGIREALVDTVGDLFSGGTAMLERAVDLMLDLASGLLSRVPGGALRLFMGIISAYMISGKLPLIRDSIKKRVPRERIEGWRQELGRIRQTVMGWLKAQVKLSAVTFCLALVGLLLLRIPHSPLWAAVIALVDAFPVLGTGTVLLPWSLISFLQGDHFRAFALLGLYGAAAVTRTVLEPRLVGRQLGLDPLITLMALYGGYQLFGLPGMLLAPVAAVAVVQVVNPVQREK